MLCLDSFLSHIDSVICKSVWKRRQNLQHYNSLRANSDKGIPIHFNMFVFLLKSINKEFKVIIAYGFTTTKMTITIEILQHLYGLGCVISSFNHPTFLLKPYIKPCFLGEAVTNSIVCKIRIEHPNVLTKSPPINGTTMACTSNNFLK